MKRGQTIFGATALSMALASVGYAHLSGDHTPVEFFTGRTHHEDGHNIGALQHSGGTDADGCHNAPVPYHCH